MRIAAIETSLKKCKFKKCGWGPSDCQNWAVDGWRSCGIEQPGLEEETVQEAREEISLRG